MAYDPTTDIDPGYDIEGHTADDDMGQQEQREQAAVTPRFRPTAPGVLSPTPAPAPRPQRQGITPYEPRSNRPPADGTFIVGDEEYGYKPDASAPVTGKVTWKDWGDQLVASSLGSAGALASGVSWIQHQINSDPQYRAYADDVKDFAEKHAEATLNGMSDKAKQVLHASLFGSGRDAEGNAVPSPGDVGWGSYLAMHFIGMIPDGAAMLLPGGILGRVAVKGLELAGGAARAIKAGETVATLTKAGETAKAIGHGAGTAGYFSVENGGQLASTIGNEIRDAKDADLQSGSDVYKHLRDSGMDVDTAKRELFKQSTAMIVGAFAAGAVGGGGFGVLGKGVVRGAIAGAGAMGIQGGATQALQQGAEKAMGMRTDYDLGSIMSDTLESGGMGLVLGGIGGRFAGRERAPKPGVDPDIGAALEPPPAATQGEFDLGGAPPGFPPGGAPGAQGEMFRTAAEANAPPPAQGEGVPLTQQPAPTPAPGPVSSRAGGMPGAVQEGLPINQTPPTIVPTTGQGEMFPSLPEANPPVQGARVPLTEARGETPPTPAEIVQHPEALREFQDLQQRGFPAQEANYFRDRWGMTTDEFAAEQRKPLGGTPPAGAPPAGGAPAGGKPMSASERKRALVAELTGKPGAPSVAKLRRGKIADLEKMRDQLNATQPDTTVVSGAERAPASEIPAQDTSETAAPPVSGEALTPPVTPEGVQKTAPTTPTTPTSTTGLTEGLSGAARAIGENLRNMLWAKHEAGDTTEAGKPSNILRASSYLKERGVITDRASFEKFLNDYGAAQKAGELKTKAGVDNFFEKQLTGREPAPEVRPEGEPSPDTMAKSGEGIAPKVEAKAETKAEAAVKVSKGRGRPKKVVETPVEKPVEEPTAATTAEPAHDVGEARDDVREKLANVRRVVKPPRGTPVEGLVNKAFAEIQASIDKTDGSTSSVMEMLHQVAQPREGDTAGQHTARHGVAAKLAEQMGQKLPRIAAKVVEDKRPEIEQVRAAEEQAHAAEATARATSGEAIEEKAAAGETTKLEPVQRKVPKGTDIVERAKAIINKLLDPSDPMDAKAAEAEYNKLSKAGRPRRAGYDTVVDALHTELKRVTEPGVADKLREQLAKNDQMPLHTREGSEARQIEEDKRDAKSKEITDKLADYEPSRVSKIIEHIKELSDPVADAADKRAAMEAKMAADRAARQGELPVHEQRQPYRAPRVEGIPPESSAYIKAVRDPILNGFLRQHVDSAEFEGRHATLHGVLDAIIQNGIVKRDLRPLWEMATRMRKLVGDIPVVTPDEAARRGWMPRSQYMDLFNSNRRVAGYHSVGREGQAPEHIVLNTAGQTHVETLLHETVHAASSRYIDRLLKVEPNHPHLEVLRAIGRELAGQAEKVLGNEDYLRFHHDLEQFTRSVLETPDVLHEVHAWLMTNSVLQDFAARTVASPEFRARMMELGYGPRPQGRSVWRAFSDWVQRALGYNKPESGSETAFLDHILRPLQDITDAGAKYNERLLPHDPVVRAQGEPLFHDLGTAFRRGAGEVFDRVDPMGLGATARRGVFSTAPADRLIERYEHLAQAGDRNYLRDLRTAYEKAQVTTAGFLRDFGDRARDIARALRGKDEVASLMNDVGYGKIALGTADDVAANAHLTTPEERAALADAQRRFNALSPADRELYKTTRDFGAEKYARERESTANRQINDWLPHGTDAERAFLRTAMRTKAGMEAYLANPDNPAIDASRRVIARGLVKLHLDGFVPGDYFPMRRYGNYVVEYGEQGTPSYGMQKFESMAKAEAFRREAANNGLNPQSVREADAIVQHGLMRPSAAIQEMLDKINVTPELREHGPQLREMVTKLQLQYASTAERARARRRGIAGASKDIGRAIQDDTAASALRVGAHEHNGERDAAMRALKFHGDELARTNEKGAFTLDQVRHEFERRFGIGDDGGWKGASGLARKLTSFGYAHTLMSFSRVAVETAELHLKMGAFIGARHGPARAALEMGRALKDISPSLWTKGAKNTYKAFIGKPLSSVDYQLGEMARQRLLDKGYNPAEVNGFFKHFHENGLFDQTTAQALKELARPSNMGKAFNWFVDVSSAMSHASEESNRIAGTWAAFRAERANGKSISEANRFAEDTLRKAPNFNPTNRPRISSDKGIFGKFSAPIMQFKMYGLNEHWMLANLARDVISRSTDPAKRKEAIYALAGTIAAHSMMAGVLTWYTDPARYIGGAYDLITGQKPHDRTLDARKWLADTIGPTWGEILGRGAPHAIGIDSSHRSGVGNMLNMPDMNGFTPKDWALFVGQLAMGAPGEDAAAVADGVGKAIHGDYLGGIKEMLPRILRDPVKAYDYSQRGVTDTRGKTILAPEKISPWSIAVQAAGFIPSEVSEAREKRTAIMQTRDRMQAEHADLTSRWLAADPADRPAVMSEIRQWNADPANIGARIQTGSLLQALHRRRKENTREGAYGLTLPKKGAQQMLEAGRF